MYNKPNPSQIRHLILTNVILLTLLAACAPTGTAAPETAVVDPATAEFTETATFTVTATPAPIFTATPSPTLTATLSPEEAAAAEQAAIRAEVLSYGINLDDLAHSENEYVRNHPGIADTFQEALDNSFGESNPGSATMIVLEIEQLQSLEEYKQAFTTDGGWKFIVWAKVAYKDVAGNWIIANLPMTAYNEETQEFWLKAAQNTGPIILPNITQEAATRSFEYSNEQGIISMQEDFKANGNFYLITGAIFRLNTAYPDPNVKLNSGEVGDPPRFSEEEMLSFWQTGDPSIFNYHLTDGTYIIWPFVNYDAISHIDYQIP
jgi:hypothetical protein